MVDDILTTVVQLSGNMVGMVMKYGIIALPGVIAVMAGAPITLMAAGIAAVPGFIIAMVALAPLLGALLT